VVTAAPLLGGDVVRTGESGTGWALLTEERLIARARGGDQPAFAELVRRHGASAWYLGLVVTGSPTAATEAAGRGLMRTMATLDPTRWNAPEPYRAWLLRSVHAAAMGGHPGSAPDLIDLTDRIDEGTGTGPGQAAMAYASLPEKQRAALWMAEVEALSVDEVARGLDLEALDAARTLERGRVGFAASVGSWRDDQHFAHLPGALAAFALPVPPALEEDALGRWRTWVALSRAPETALKSSRRSVRMAWTQVRDNGLGARVAAAAAIVVFLLGAVGAALVGSQGQETTDTPLAVQAGPQTSADTDGDPATTAEGGDTATTAAKGKAAKQTAAPAAAAPARAPGTTGTTRPGDDPVNRRPGTTAPPPTDGQPLPPPPTTTTRPHSTTTTTRPRTTTTTTEPTTTTTEPTTTTTEPTTTTTTESTTTTTTVLPCDLPLVCP
jgi:DNA-directed RNA polymerase specialized sigma24 family protein